MDFLDPKAKRRRENRLIIGYTLMAVLIGLATFLLIFRAYGFNLDRKSGEVIQNGLVFVDSSPDEANVKFNGKSVPEKTNNRFALPSGNYDLQINKDGYREWRRSFELNGGEVERFTYPLLILNTLQRQELKNFAGVPTFSTQSPDRRWSIVAQAGSFTDFIEFDLNSLDKNKPKERNFSLPANLFTNSPGARSLELVEWSTDNKHVLVKHNFTGGSEFVIISREQPETSFNINRLLNQNPTKVTLRDKKFDQWFLYQQAGGIVQTADAKKTVTQILTNVSSFKTHGADTILYAQPQADGKTQRITYQDGKDSYELKDVTSATVLLDIAQYDGSWYAVVGADAEQKTYVFKNPVEVLKRRDGTKPAPISILKSSGPTTNVSFSQNTRFITAQSNQHFETFDAEYEKYYKFDQLKQFDPDSKVVWMDGHRLLGRFQNKALVFDFDGSNSQELVNGQASAPFMFDRDFEVLYTLDGSATAGKTGFYTTELRLAGDK